MSTTQRRTSTRGSAGKKAGASESPKQSFVLKNRCKQLTIGDYIDLICEDNLDVLVVEGKPDKNALNEAKMAVLSEFGELCGGGESETMTLYKKIIRQQAQISTISMTLNVLVGDLDGSCLDEARKILQECGISTHTWTRETLGADIKRAESFMKAKEVRLGIDIKHYNKLVARPGGAKITEADIRGEISVISSQLGYTIKDDCCLATYAAHRKNYAAYVKAIQKVEQKTKRK